MAMLHAAAAPARPSVYAATHVGHVIHSDILGPIDVPDAPFRYVLHFIDEYSLFIFLIS